MAFLLEMCGCGKPPPLGFQPKQGPANSVHAGDIDSAPIKIEGAAGKKIGYFSNHGWEQKASFLGAGKKQVCAKSTATMSASACTFLSSGKMVQTRAVILGYCTC